MCTNNILVKEQYGFRINSSSKASSYNVINKTLKAMNNRLYMGGKFCDLEKALSVLTMEFLEFYGISGKFLTLIQSYLRERYQEVLIEKINAYDSVSSRWKQVTNGVTQILILGPNIFSYLY